MVFDVGGVIELTPATGWARRWASLLGIDEPGMATRLSGIWRAGGIGAITAAEVEQETAAVLGIGGDELASFLADVWAEYLGTLNDELVDYFAGLRPRYRTGILSNSFVGAREREREAYDLEARCDVVVYSHEEGVAKPDPRFYRIVCQRLGVVPDEVVFLDDKQHCVDGAVALGMKAVLFRANDQAIAEIEAHLLGTATAGMTLPGCR